MTILVLFGCVLALVLIDVPIAVSLGIVAVAAMIVSHGAESLPNLPISLYNGATNFPLIAIPLFILAGAIMNASGISQRLIAFASACLGFIRGGLAMVAIGASLFFAEISGSAVADISALGSILIPAMKSKGYPAPLAAAILSSSATLAVIIPPSIPMILYAVMAETSVVQLFVAGIVPGVVGGFGLMGMAYWFARRYNLPIEEKFRWARVRQTFREAFWAFTLPVIILGAIFGGIVTATEGAAMAVVASLFIGLVIYRELDLKHLKQAMIEGAVQTAVVMLLVAASALLGNYLSEIQAPQHLAATVASITQNKWLVLALLNVLFLRPRHVPALRGRDHPRGARGDAAGALGRHRPDPLRAHRHGEPGHRAANAAGGLGAHGRLLHRQGDRMGSDAGEHLVHRGALRHPACCAPTGRDSASGLVRLFYH